MFFGQMSITNFLSVKCLLTKSLFVKCWSAKCVLVKCFLAKCLLPKCPSTQCMLAKCLSAMCLLAKSLLAKCLSPKWSLTKRLTFLAVNLITLLYSHEKRQHSKLVSLTVSAIFHPSLTFSGKAGTKWSSRSVFVRVLQP